MCCKPIINAVVAKQFISVFDEGARMTVKSIFFVFLVWMAAGIISFIYIVDVILNVLLISVE